MNENMSCRFQNYARPMFDRSKSNSKKFGKVYCKSLGHK